MQQIIFRTQSPQMTLTLNDVGTSKIEYAKNYSDSGDEEPQTTTEKFPYLDLFNFDCNSLGTSSDMVTCIGMPGQHTISTKIQPRTMAITLAYDGRTGGRDYESQMYKLRRLIMRCFPLGVKGELEYTNSNGTFFIDCYATEYPNMERSVGTRTVATFYLIADYPFWRQNHIGNLWTVGAGSAQAIVVLTKGDMGSPISGTITCTQTQSGLLYGYSAIRIWRTDKNSDVSMKITKPLTEGQKLIFNSGINNEIYFKLQDTDGTIRTANDYVDYQNSSLLRNDTERTVWQINVNGDEGEIEIQMNYQNLYWAV